jgi:hypothetical protein
MYSFNPQANVDRINSINNEIANLEMRRTQAMMPQPITQNFQMLNSNATMRFANNLEEVQRDYVITDTPFFSKDMSVVWIKNQKGNIKTYELNEIVPKDEKDLQIEYLQEQIKELKGMFKNEQSIRDDDATENATDTTRNDETDGTTIETNKPTSIQRVSTSKKR